LWRLPEEAKTITLYSFQIGTNQNCSDCKSTDRQIPGLGVERGLAADQNKHPNPGTRIRGDQEPKYAIYSIFVTP
jgi:hypothetical protein